MSRQVMHLLPRWLFVGLMVLLTIAVIQLAPAEENNQKNTIGWIGLALSAVAIASALLVLRVNKEHVEKANLFRFMVVISPTVLLMASFAVAYSRISDVQLAGMNTVYLLLAVSVTVPWISSVASRPLYWPLFGISREGDGFRDEIYRSFAKNWRPVLAWSLVAVAVSAAAFGIAQATTWQATALYAFGVFGNIVFAQLLVPAQEAQRYGVVLAAWVIYAAIIAIFPQWWLLAPLAGSVPALVLLGKHLVRFTDPADVTARGIVVDMYTGFTIGAVLWADKLFLVFVYGQPVMDLMYVVYIALIPMILGTAMYWTRQYLFMQASVQQIWTVIETVPSGKLEDATRGLSVPVSKSITDTLIPTSIAMVSIGLLLPFIVNGYSQYWMALLVMPLVALTLMICNHHLEQVSQTRVATALNLAATVACTSLAVLPINTAYLVIIAVYLVLIAISFWLRAWTINDAPYRLFWKEAVSL
ncbi:hypothetical protein [Corynebacterium cystitidis]|uniref:hypothetical protein n=1 Tax=Corynebacterium cystitidis TaxID=35757 RepID=UPI00211F3AAE|nr:hypothetical protein [Corynebacterium cystitidis]